MNKPVLIQIFVDCSKDWIGSVAADSTEIVSVQGPDHGTTQTFRIGVFNLNPTGWKFCHTLKHSWYYLQLNGLLIVVTEPLVAVLDMWYLLFIIPGVLPTAVQFTNFIVPNHTHSACVRTGFTSSISSSVQRRIIWISQSETAAVGSKTNVDFLGISTLIQPVFNTGSLDNLKLNTVLDNSKLFTYDVESLLFVGCIKTGGVQGGVVTNKALESAMEVVDHHVDHVQISRSHKIKQEFCQNHRVLLWNSGDVVRQLARSDSSRNGSRQDQAFLIQRCFEFSKKCDEVSLKDQVDRKHFLSINYLPCLHRHHLSGRGTPSPSRNHQNRTDRQRPGQIVPSPVSNLDLRRLQSTFGTLRSILPY